MAEQANTNTDENTDWNTNTDSNTGTVKNTVTNTGCSVSVGQLARAQFSFTK